MLLVVFEHCDALWGATVQPRQGRVKVARQELPGKPKDEGQSRQGRLTMGSYQPSLPESVVLVFLPGSFLRQAQDRLCRAIFSRA